MKKVAILDDEIFDLLEQKEAEIELSNTLVRNDRIFALVASMEEASDKNENNEVSLISNTSSTSNNNLNEVMCKLPKLVIKEFDGSVLNWQTFWDQFESTIHSKTNISNVDKFSYLTSFLCKSAYDTISGLAPTNQNYLEAVQLLKNRYGNPQLLINTYMEQFVQLEKIEKSNDVVRLRMFYNKVEITIRNIKSLNIEPSDYGSLLIPVLTSKLPTDLRTLFARKFSDRVCELNELLILFKNELQAKERSFSSGYNPREKQDRNSNFSTSSLLLRSGNAKLSCVFCESSNHSSNRCPKVTDPKIRKQCIFQKSLCYIYLSPKHKAANCKSNYLCKKCNGSHNIAICQKDIRKPFHGNNQQGYSGSGISNNPIDQNSAVQNPSDPNSSENRQAQVIGQQVNTASNFSGNASNNVLLQTAEANVLNLYQNNTAKSFILFDSGAQRTYITKELKEKLNLLPFKQEKIAIKVFGSTESKIQNIDVVKFMVIGTRKNVYVEALVIPTICSNLYYQYSSSTISNN